MQARERVNLALAHQEADRVPLDLGSTAVTGMHVSSVYRLRQVLALDEPGEPVRITNIYQMLGEIKPDLAAMLGVDTVALPLPVNSFGIENEGWKVWQLHDGTPVLVPEGFNTDPEPNGDLLMYPQGDKSAPPSGRMPAGGYYFDAIIRQPPLDPQALNPADNLEEFQPLSEATLAYYARESTRLYTETEQAIIANMGGTGFGDLAHVPGIQLKHPRGIRDIEEWYVSIASRQDYLLQVFEQQCEIALQNLERFHQAVGERISAIFVSGTDFGGQHSLLISPRAYRRLFKPFHTRLNDWIHSRTGWKTFLHTDGAVRSLLPDLVEAGFDILNPVQWTASGMDPAELKQSFGRELVFWGAGVDTQHTLPFGKTQDIYDEIRAHMEVFKPGGGFIFAGVHNIQAGVPVENLLALFNAYRTSAAYTNASAADDLR